MKEISKRARQYVKEERDKYGFDLAWQYFSYNINWNEPLNEWDIACKKAFDYWHKKERIKTARMFYELALFIRRNRNDG